MIDALPRHGRAAAIAAVWALLTDATVEHEAIEQCEALPNPWTVANSDGLADAAVRDTASGLLSLAADRLRATNPQLAAACDLWRAGLTGEGSPSSIDELLQAAEQ